jgi:hypothetical protein
MSMLIALSQALLKRAIAANARGIYSILSLGVGALTICTRNFTSCHTPYLLILRHTRGNLSAVQFSKRVLSTESHKSWTV